MFSEQLFGEFFNYSNVGLAVLDENLCFCCINDTLSCINGRPMQEHPGRHIQEMLGSQIATQLELVMRQVLQTGRPVVNVNLNGRLAAKPCGGRWIGNYFPLPDRDGVVHHVGAVVVELEAGNETVGAIEENQRVQKILRSWKDIAHYTGVCAKTVQRWEQNNHLPIHRVNAGKGFAVFALSDEVDSWLRSQAMRRH